MNFGLLLSHPPVVQEARVYYHAVPPVHAYVEGIPAVPNRLGAFWSRLNTLLS
ncbi:hypothetical protein SBC1_52570 (plasmid) [Caballeronia sp. SBC1]|uniref:hypothetical protein n=1 Tax=unclassified Caballeronia TaxID=2646786 RepID=UPI0013E1AE61|nr:MULTISPECIES: hypothetical protein [unclassified Caballeronia]QIE27307.1 hypothetical protein SBC2_53770 [Caballeronia sp. SBC2]QIN65212.1 hypothetical protein SBC1_52570 [Caballeronia sp. SBC1]